MKGENVMRGKERREGMLRCGLGALLGLTLVPLSVRLLLSMGTLAGPPGWVAPAMAERFGPGGALALQALLSALFGGAVGLSTLPFAPEGRSLLRRSLAHFGATLASFLVMGRVCCWWQDWQGLSLMAGLLVLVYLLVWLARHAGGSSQVEAIRRGLGLTAEPSPLRWRETLTYLAFAGVLCDLVPLVLRGVERLTAVDVPVLTGLILPFLVLPVGGFVSGLSLGRRWGFAPLYPAGCALLYLPMVFLLYNSSALFHCWMAALAALAGNGAGALIRRRGRGQAG